MKFLSDILAKAGLTVDGVVTFNNTATGQTPATNDNSTKLATTAFIKNQSYLSANQTITVSGDATGSGVTSIALTLANSGVTAGTYGNASNIPTIVVDAKGRITSISTNAVSIITTLAGLSDVTLTSPSTNQVLQYNGTRWVNGAAPTTYTLPIATSSVLGGIKIGSGLSIDAATGIVTVSGGGGGGNLNYRTIQEFTSTSGQTTYTISGGYAVGYVEVLVNGVYISENQYTATNGSTIVLTDPNTTGDIVTVFLYSLYNLGASVYARNVDTLTATAGQTSFTTSYIPGQIDVYYNGSKLTAAEYTATTGASIVLGQAAVSGDIIEVVTYLAGAGLNSNRTLTINGTTYDLTANRTWTLTTANISEVTNLYYTDARARAAISVAGSGSYNSSTGVITVTGGVTSVNTLTGAVVLTTTNIAEGTNLYYTQARFDTAFGNKSTTNLAEGINLYYTDARVGTYLTTNSYATQTYVGTQIANLVASAPATLDTLNELAAALGNDPSFATTIATSIGTKEPAITAGTTSQYWRGDKSWQTLPVYTLSGLGGVPTTRTITINGTTLDLSADRSFTIAGGVTSFNTRTGAITPASGDYTTALVTESGNLYYTNARARLAISLSTTGTSGAATYDSATGVLNIPQYQGGVTSFNTRTGAITLSSLDVTTALTYTPVTNARTITINGTSYDLSANRSWTIAPDVSVRNTYAFTATAAQTTFTVTGGYSVGLVDVFINGIKLAAADFTATNGITVVLGTGTGVGNIVEIVKYVSAFTTAVETTRTLTINGTTYDLSANRTWSINNASLGAQAQLNGTGLVRMSGTTVSYDNATYATQSYVTTAVANLVNSAPSTLDTLNELATALGNDANFATTITTSIATKQPQLNGTGFVKISGTTISYDNSTYLTTGTASSTYQTILTNPVTGTGTTNYLPKFTGASTIGNSNLINDASGNLGLGVTPSAWGTFTAFQVGNAATWSTGANNSHWSSNTYYNGSDRIYISSDFATEYVQQSGAHKWFIASSGTAGGVITATQAMTLFSDGNLLLTNSTISNAGYKLDVNGTGRFSGALTAATYLTLSEDATYPGPYYTLGFSGKSNGSNRIFADKTGADGIYIASATSTAIYFRAGGGTTNNLTIASTGAATFSSIIKSSDTNGFAIGSIASFRRIQYGSDAATSFSLLTDTNSYAGLYAGAATFSSSATFGSYVSVGNTSGLTKLNVNNAVSGAILPYIQGTGLSYNSEGISVAGSNTNNTNIGNGITFYNNVASVGAYGPVVSWSSMTVGGAYNATYAFITGVYKGAGGDNNWAIGDLIFGTGNSYGATERMRLTVTPSNSISCLLVNKTTPSASYPIQTTSTNGGYMASANGPGDANYYSTSPTIGYHFYGDQGGAAKFNVTGGGKGYFAAGVQFGSGSSTLNYYQEGSWTPQLYAGASAFTMGGINDGRYVRVGNLVTISGHLQWSSGSGSGMVRIAGLPYTCYGVRSAGSMGAVSYGISFNSGYNHWVLVVDPGTDYIYIIQGDSSGGGYSHTPPVGSSGIIYGFTITYHIL